MTRSMFCQAAIALCMASITSIASADVELRSGRQGQAAIFITGEITEADTARTVMLMKAAGAGGGTVYFDTQGGDLFAGLDLGQEIRRMGFATSVAGAAPSGLKPGTCQSVCVLSLIGGKYRYAEQGSTVGVHRFYRRQHGSAVDLDVGQVMSAAITSHIDDMGVDKALFDLIVKSGRGEMLMLKTADLTRLGVINNGVLPAEWSIVGKGGLVYLLGTQETWNGLGKITMSCAPNRSIKFAAIFDGGLQTKTFVENASAYSLRIEDRFIPIDRLAGPAKMSGHFGLATFVPTRSVLEQLKTANSVGFAFHGQSLSTFFGFLVQSHQHKELIASFVTHCTSPVPG